MGLPNLPCIYLFDVKKIQIKFINFTMEKVYFYISILQCYNFCSRLI